MSKLITYPVNGHVTDALPSTISGRTRKVYDALSLVYPMSTFFFHSKAHRLAMEMSGIRDGMRVLEVATGSGEMFERLVNANPNGSTVGLDLSPNMAARTQRIARRKFPESRTQCKAVDARYMPFRDESFDSVMCCYLLELLSSDDIVVALQEMYRVLRRRGTFTLVLIGQNTEFFNQAYKVCGSLAPAFWGRQVETRIPELIESLDFRITGNQPVRQGFYPSRVLTARK
ncbi:MAG TPA: methyltransferase domain-containing protein [Bryobacteraceae bacterium]|nr:methyltransferase domain-containing protein [Bryobacteraceae bacterium]